MERIFTPRSIAFIGASNNLGKWGGIILHNLIDGGYQGGIYPVNPRDGEVQGLRAYRRVSDVPGEVDLALFTIPAAAMPEAVSDCVNKGVPAGVVVTAGFSELGAEGEELQTEMVGRARAGNMVLVGPNGQGIVAPNSKLFPWMPMFRPRPGPVGISSQSGNISTFLSEGLAEFGIGCSKVISSGNCADLDFADYLEYFREDPETEVVILYIEGVGHGRDFMEAARRTSLEKPVVAIKSGRTEVGVRAASTHTGALACSDDAFTAACRQAGVARASSIEEAVILAGAFLSTPLPRGNRVGIVTGGGGLGVIAADACDQAGLEMAELTGELIEKLSAHLPPWWAPNNPVDLVAGIGYGGPREIIPVLMEGHGVDGVIMLGIGWMYSMFDSVNDPTDFRGELNEHVKRRLDGDMKYCKQMGDLAFKYGKPLLMTSPVARLAVRREYPGLLHLLERGVMLFPTIEDAINAFSALRRRAVFLEREGAGR